LKGLVLAGGFGTRLRPLTYGFAKQLIPVANKPVLFYALEDLRQAGVRDLVLNVSPHSREDVMSAVGDGGSFGLRVEYSVQEQPLGIAHAIKIAKPFLQDDSFIVYLGDNLLRNGIRKYAEQFSRPEIDALALVSRVSNPQRFGTVEVENGRVVKLVEKPKKPTSDLAMVGVYFLRPSSFDSIDRLKLSWRNELEIVDAYQDMVNKGMNVKAVEVDGWWVDTGTTEDLLVANRLLLDDFEPSSRGRVEKDASCEGKVSLGEGTVIRGGARIIGPVVIVDHSQVGDRATIGPYTSVGSGVKISSCSVANSIVMDGARIDADIRITDSLVGRKALIVRRYRPSETKFVVGQQSVVEI
jgi:glucose-1-phosphate thymidylyltransferase